MTPDKEKELAQHLEAIVREKTLQYITPQLGVFLLDKLQGHNQEELEN